MWQALRPLARLGRVAAPLLALALGGCALVGGGDRASDDTGQVAATGPVLETGYARIASLHIDPPPLPRLAATGLAATQRYDGDIVVRLTDNAVILRHGERRVAELARPDTDGAEVWAALTARGLAELRRQVPAVANVGEERLLTAVLDAQTAELGRFSRYKDPAEAREAREARNGFGGLGLRLASAEDGGAPVIAAVRDDSPAAAAGLAAGARLVSVAGDPLTGVSAQAAAGRLRGEVGSQVHATVAAGPGGPLRVVRLARARIVAETVTWSVDRQHHAYLSVERFNAATAGDLAAALGEIRDALGGPPAGVALDLRGNPGGLLDQAVDVADLFLADGAIVRTRGRHPGSVQHYQAEAAMALDGDVPLVVLVDGMAASAAEIVAAALQDGRRAVLVGTTSYGKGSVQTVSRLPNDGELYLTWSRLFAPSDYTLAGLGVLPNLCVPLDGRGEREPAGLIEARLGGDTVSPDSMSGHFAAWRNVAVADSRAKDELRGVCPPQDQHARLAERGDRARDLPQAVAIELLDRPRLYARALAIGKPGAQVAAH